MTGKEVLILLGVIILAVILVAILISEIKDE